MVEQKKLIKEDVYEKKKIGRDTLIKQKPTTTLPKPPVSKTQEFNEPGRVSDITNQENILLKKRSNIEEIHEKPVIEVHEQPIYKNVKEPMQTSHIKDATVFEEYGNKKEGDRYMKEQLGKAPNTKMVYMKPKMSEVTEAPTVHKEYQIKKEIHNQPVIHEIHEQPVQEIHEQNIVRVVHENPEFTNVKDAPVYLSEDKRLNNMGMQGRGTKGNKGYGGSGQQGFSSGQQGHTGGQQNYDTSGQQGYSGGQQNLGGQQGLSSGQQGYKGGQQNYDKSGQQGYSGGQQNLGGQQKYDTSGQQGYSGGQQNYDKSGGGYSGKPKVLSSNFDKGYGGKGGWKKEEVYRDASGDVYKKEYKHKEHLESLPKQTYVKEDRTYQGSSLNRNRESPLSSPSSPSSPPSPSYNRGEKKPGLGQRIKEKLHIGDSHHHKKTY